MRPLPMLLALLPLPALSQDLEDWSWIEAEAPAAWAALQDAAAYCDAETEGGVLEIREDGIVETDLDGDNGDGPSGGPDDMVVDFNRIFCSRSASLWAGTGGSPVHFVLDGTEAAAWYGFEWQVERFNAYLPAVILLSRHGGVCDGAGAEPCVQAIVADRGAFLTMQYPDPWEGFGAE